MYCFSINASAPPVESLAAPLYAGSPRRSDGEKGQWKVLTHLRKWANQDIDWWRRKYGKVEGELRFFADNPDPDDGLITSGNMLMTKGSAAIWQTLIGNGTSSANTALPTPTYFSNANTYLGVGDGGIAAGTGTVAINNGSTSATFSTSQSGLQGKYIVISGDSSGGFYVDDTASGTAHTFETAYGGTNVSGASWSSLNAESHAQTGLQGSSNVYYQAADGGYPTNAYNAQLNVVSAASNASPIQLTTSGADISSNDIVQVFEVHGNTNANGLFVASGGSGVSSSNIPLLNSSGNGSYTYGGYVTKAGVFVVQSTFGSTSAQFEWLEWAILNGNSTNKIMLNRKVTNLGTKSTGTWALLVGLAIQ